MKSTSFHLTPELLKNRVPLNIWKDGKLQLFDPEVRLFETDPERGDFNPAKRLTFV